MAGRLHRRVRILVAVGEALAAIALAWLAWWCWHRGVIVTEDQGLLLNRIEGRWWTAAIGAATLAGILLLDALRESTRAVASRPRAAPPFLASLRHAVSRGTVG
ncbi:MAG: hypothetical protein ACRDS9_13830 [Pseudonocardiaceae bacterium]